MFISRVEYSDETQDAIMEGDYQPAHRSNAETVLDDVFGANDSGPSGGVELSNGNSFPSDMPRLEREHATAGYRDGITAAKALSVQAGFDEGFSLGASIGTRVGQVLGLLDGIAESVCQHLLPTSSGVGEAAADTDGDERASIGRLAQTARDELKADAVFGAEYWFPDGTWKFNVAQEGDGADITFEDVANAHPLIRKWAALAEDEARRWKIDMNIWAASTEPAIEEPRLKEDVLSMSKPVTESKNSRLDW
ncbi:hypothetical protein jhhlp_004092 [Lomentospora prolificans]|uniref:Protein YAE1 n=1 Tax=Lomentospora prolificans TaxID=41688 RepID=A0A2N3NAK3_9PEZI|nr:hypothetical protein jhhlp_004092 [Lomentospora prolificans]